MSLLLILLVVILLFGGGGFYGYRSGWGNGGVSVLGVLALIVVLYLVFGSPYAYRG